mgnify:CR=1 FL=1
MKWWQTILINSVMFLALAGFFSGFIIDSVWTAIMAALILGALNLLVKPILVLLSLPLTILTLGIFYFIINASMLYLTSAVVSGFDINSFGLAFLISLIMSFVNSMFARQ